MVGKMTLCGMAEHNIDLKRWLLVLFKNGAVEKW